LNKKSLESLAKCGAMDSWEDRGKLLANMENILNYSKELSKNKNNGQTSLFADAPLIFEKQKVRLDLPGTVNQQEKLSWEKELLGLYISEHPFNEFRKHIEKHIIQLGRLKDCSRDSNLTVAGVITSIKKIITRSNDSMLFVKIEDHSSNVEILVFPSLLKASAEIWQDGKVIMCQGRLSDKDQEVKLLASKVVELKLDNVEACVKEFNDAKEVFKNNKWKYANKATPTKKDQPVKPDKSLKLVFNQEFDEKLLSSLKEYFLKYSGTDKVYFKIIQNGTSNIIETGFRVENNEELAAAIKKLGDAITIVP